MKQKQNHSVPFIFISSNYLSFKQTKHSHYHAIIYLPNQVNLFFCEYFASFIGVNWTVLYLFVACNHNIVNMIFHINNISKCFEISMFRISIHDSKVYSIFRLFACNIYMFIHFFLFNIFQHFKLKWNKLIR